MNNFLENLNNRIVFLIIIFLGVSGISYPQDVWLNFTNSKEVRDITFTGKFIWAATGGGLLRINRETGKQTQFNRSNSGIPSNNISRLVIDSSGSLWVGTYDQGIANYDGNTWTTFDNFNISLQNKRILSLMQDDEGIIWIGTEMGLYRYYSNQFHNDLNAGVIIQDILQDENGVIWVGRSGGITKINNYRFESLGQTYQPYPFFDVRDLCKGKDNKIWILSKEGIISYQDGKFDKLDLNNLDFPYGIITSLAVDLDNNLWLGSPYGRLAKYNGVTFEIYNDKNSELSSTRINRLKTDESGIIWACTNNGIYRYKTGLEYIPTSGNRMRLDQNTKIFSDAERNIWICDGGDLFCFGKNENKYYGRENSKFKGASALLDDSNGKIWMGHAKGLTSFDGNNWKEYDSLQILLLNREKEIFNIRKDTAWVKENYKNYLIDSGYYFEPDYYITKLYLDNSGALWMKASEFLVKYDMKNWTIYDEFNSGIPAKNITCLTGDDENNIWFGTSKHGLYKFDGDEFSSCLTARTFEDTNIVSLNNFNDTLVVSTDKRIFFQPDADFQQQNKLFLISPFVRDILRDSEGNYWFGTNFGLFEFTSPEKRAMYDIHNSGLASNYVSSVREDFAGNLWVLTSTGGVNIFNENTIVDEQRIKDFFLIKE